MRGIGSMLHELGGGSEESASKYYGKEIETAEIAGDSLKVKFKDGPLIEIYDDGQSCCESRYMSTDDDVKFLEGKVLKSVLVKTADGPHDEYGEHEIAFVEIMTTQGSVTLANHNEHNGYYGGFGLTIQEI